ncbi:hypothetical protein MAR_019919, partial [Mya arenaria]
IDKDIFCPDKQILLVSLYNPPQVSPFYTDKTVSGLSELETLLCDSEYNLQAYELLLCGDLSARTGVLNDFININLINGRVGSDKCVGDFTYY